MYASLFWNLIQCYCAQESPFRDIELCKNFPLEAGTLAFAGPCSPGPDGTHYGALLLPSSRWCGARAGKVGCAFVTNNFYLVSIGSQGFNLPLCILHAIFLCRISSKYRLSVLNGVVFFYQTAVIFGKSKVFTSENSLT